MQQQFLNCVTFLLNHSLSLDAYRSIFVPFPFCSEEEGCRKGLDMTCRGFYRRSQILSEFFSLQCNPTTCQEQHAKGLSWSEVLHVSPAPKWWFATCLPPGCSPRIENMVSGRSLTTEIPELEESAAHSCSYLVETTYFTLILFFLSAHWGILLLQEPVLFLHLMESFTEDLCIFLGSKNTEMLQKCRWKHFSRTIFRILFCLTDVLHFCCPKHSWEGRQQEGRSLVHPDMIKSVGIVLTTHHMMRQRQHTRLNPCSLQLHKGVGMLASQADQNHIHSYPRPTFLLCTQRIRPGLNAGGILAIPSAIQHWRKKKNQTEKKSISNIFCSCFMWIKKWDPTITGTAHHRNGLGFFSV